MRKVIPEKNETPGRFSLSHLIDKSWDTGDGSDCPVLINKSCDTDVIVVAVK